MCFEKFSSQVVWSGSTRSLGTGTSWCEGPWLFRSGHPKSPVCNIQQSPSSCGFLSQLQASNWFSFFFFFFRKSWSVREINKLQLDFNRLFITLSLFFLSFKIKKKYSSWRWLVGYLQPGGSIAPWVYTTAYSLKQHRPYTTFYVTCATELQ